jgi:hypothetical protein
MSSDRSLLVPILGSLAEMPLNTEEKSQVLETVQFLLDAAAEEDMPAVVQSVLSILISSSAEMIVLKLRSACNKIQSGTLALVLEVIGRFATMGSLSLKYFLRILKQSDQMTLFDILLMSFLMGKVTEADVSCKVDIYLSISLLN